MTHKIHTTNFTLRFCARSILTLYICVYIIRMEINLSETWYFSVFTNALKIFKNCTTPL